MNARTPQQRPGAAGRQGPGAGDGLFPAPAVWGLAFVVVGVALATAAAWPLYEAPRALLVGLGGGAIGMAVAVVSRLLRWGPLLASVLAGLVYVVVAAPFAVPSSLSSPSAFLGGVRDAVLGVALGWKQILTLAPPLGEYQAVLVPFLVVVYVGAFVAALLVLDRRRRAALSVVVVAAMSVFGIAFGASATSAPLRLGGIVLPAPREWAVGVAVFLCGLVFLIGRARLERSRALRAVAAQNVSRRATPVWLRIRRHLLAGALVVVALVAGVAVAPAAAGWGDRSVLRDAVEPLVVVRQQPSPLAEYRSWFTADKLDETVVTVEGDQHGIDRLRIATLDAYDGQDFHVGADVRFSRLPRAAGPGGDRARLTLTIGDAYSGIWVPAPAHLAQAPSFAGRRADALADGFHRDEAGDTAITIAKASGGRTGLVPGDSYEVLADAPASAPSLSDAQAGEPLLDVEEHPALAEWAGMQELPRTGGGYLELIDRLRARGYLSHSLLDDEAAAGWTAELRESEGYSFAASYAGHSTARIEELFASLVEQQRRAGADASPDMLVAAVGDDEQFATAAALLARLWGFESRVVLGVRLAAAEEVPGVPACDTVCTGRNMTAWTEVREPGGAWVAVDATPQFAQLPSLITEGEQLPEHPTVPEQPRSEALDPPQAQSDSRSSDVPAEQATTDGLAAFFAIARVVGLSLAGLLLLVLPLLVILAAKCVRGRARRGAADPEVRLVAAWEELTDLYADNDVPLGPGTRVQSAEASGSAAAVRLAALVDRGVFSAHPPAAADAAQAWEVVDAERARLRKGNTWWRSLRAALGLRSFLSRLAPRSRGASSGRHLAVGTLAVAGEYRNEEDE
ncbi:transglutaminase domain-containing protein [Microbacterium sp. XT11]|uniref:transglutaminase domain-containing protein n=1 Tax=Microbacterium sp. XT11 TaxID=367477 RepID=UPI000833082A|nr:transglutaminase domain-containing protein [Microbacterium sp. XT11]